jgi:hypothetical protein
MCRQRSINIPINVRNSRVPEAEVGPPVDLQTGTSPSVGRSTIKKRTITIPQTDIPQNAGEMDILVQGGTAMINIGDE